MSMFRQSLKRVYPWVYPNAGMWWRYKLLRWCTLWPVGALARIKLLPCMHGAPSPGPRVLAMVPQRDDHWVELAAGAAINDR